VARKPTNKTDAPVKLYTTIFRNQNGSGKWFHYETTGEPVSTDQSTLIEAIEAEFKHEDEDEYMIVELVPVVSVKPATGPIITPATSFE